MIEMARMLPSDHRSNFHNNFLIIYSKYNWAGTWSQLFSHDESVISNMGLNDEKLSQMTAEETEAAYNGYVMSLIAGTEFSQYSLHMNFLEVVDMQAKNLVLYDMDSPTGHTSDGAPIFFGHTDTKLMDEVNVKRLSNRILTSASPDRSSSLFTRQFLSDPKV